MKQTTNDQVISFSASFATLYNKLIGESADRNVTIFVRTNYNSLKEAWQSWQKFGNRAHSGDCNPLIIICLMAFFDQQKMVRNKIAEQIQFRPSSPKIFREEGLNDIRSDAKEIIPDYPFLSVPARQ